MKPSTAYCRGIRVRAYTRSNPLGRCSSPSAYDDSTARELWVDQFELRRDTTAICQNHTTQTGKSLFRKHPNTLPALKIRPELRNLGRNPGLQSPGISSHEPGDGGESLQNPEPNQASSTLAHSAALMIPKTGNFRIPRNATTYAASAGCKFFRTDSLP